MKCLIAFVLAMLASVCFADPPTTIVIGGTTYTQCGLEGGNCTWTGGGNRVVAFGDGPPDDPTVQAVTTGSAVPSNGGCFVGGLFSTDPAPGFDKACYSVAGGGGTPAPTVTLTASPTSITSGGSSTLTLATTNATSCTGPVSGTSGTTSVSPTTTTTYTENCTGAGGSGSGSATVTVTAGTPAPTATLTASPNPINVGQSTVLTWSSTNATSCSGVGTGTSGSATVSPTVTTTYTETCHGSTAPDASASVTVTVNQNCANSGFTVGSPTVAAGGTPNGTIVADTPDTNTTRVFNNNVAFSIKITTNVASADTVTWNVKDDKGATVANGSYAVPSGTQTATLPVTSSKGGYFALAATTTGHGGALPALGTRGAGIMTFGVLPNTGLPAVTYASLDQHRFGMQGCNSNYNCLKALGVTDTIDDGQQSLWEPTGPNTFTPSSSHLNSFYQAHTDITRIVRLDGIPAWNSSTGMFNDSYSLPVNTSEYQNYMSRQGTEQASIRSTYYPTQSKNYYQVTWEPSLGWPQSQGTTFTQLYQLVYNGLHSTDANAVVMGPAEPFANNNDHASGNRITSSPGLCSFIDGVTTHAYYNAPTTPSTPPELQDGDSVAFHNALDWEIKDLRTTMQACKANMKLFNTELGISYDSGVSYSTVTQNHLWAHGVVGARSNIIFLGEGGQRTYYFFGPDFPHDLAGYGAFFDLADANGFEGATNLSPKPEAMAFAALSRILDGTNTLGPYTLPACNNTNGCVHAYAFRQFNSGKVISALWFHKNSAWTGPSSFSQTVSTSFSLPVDAAGTSGNVTVLDVYGNQSTVAYTNGQVTLTLTESPIYVVSTNATVASANVTTPTGYTGQ